MMEYDCVMGVIAPEVSLKSNKVQERIHSILVNNIVFLLEKNGLRASNIFVRAGRVIVFTSEHEKVISVLKNCFGLFFLSPAFSKKFVSVDDILVFSLGLAKNRIKGSFAVRCKSFLKECSSKDFEVGLGSKILENISGTSVDLSNPGTQLNLLVFKKECFVFFDVARGAEGLPVSSQGTVALFSTSFSSSKKLVSSLQKNGCKVFLVGEKNSGKDFGVLFPVKLVSLGEAKKLCSLGKIDAFFCDASSLPEKKRIDLLLGAKSFAPLLE